MTSAVDVLNHLLRAEYASPLCRLSESNPFMDRASAQEGLLLRAMCVEEAEHEPMLVSAILDLRGVPVPRVFPTCTGGSHFLGLSHLMPQVIAGKRDLIRIYESSPSTGHADADALKARILGRHRRHLDQLSRLHAGLAIPTGSG